MALNIMEDMRQVKDRLSARFLGRGMKNNVVARLPTLSMASAVEQADANVHAVGIGRKVTEGVVTDQMAIRFYVVQKIAPSKLPKSVLLPKTVDGLPTDVIESSPAFFSVQKAMLLGEAASGIAALASPMVDCSRDRRKRQRPVRAGVSVAHEDITAGTLGYFCRSIKKGEDHETVYLLSNNHVFANVNQAKAGDDILQPGPADGGMQADVVARLKRFKRISLSKKSNSIDAAIAELVEGADWLREVCSIGAIAGTEAGIEGMRVRKHGRTTSYTEGMITDESYDALVGMDHDNPNIIARFTNQMRIDTVAPHKSFGLGGDSGSLVVKQDEPAAVGLYFAGPEAGDYGIANHIADVLSELEIELIT